MTDNTNLSQTEKRLRDALKRLVDKKPTNRELKRKYENNKLKIVVSNVEKEAGLSNGAARRYPETKVLIESAETARVHGTNDVPDAVVRAQPIYIKIKEDFDRAKKEIKKLKAELVEKDEKLADYKERLKFQTAKMHQMSVAMWKHIPDEIKHVEIMIDAQGIGDKSNILNFNKREK